MNHRPSKPYQLPEGARFLQNDQTGVVVAAFLPSRIAFSVHYALHDQPPPVLVIRSFPPQPIAAANDE